MESREYEKKSPESIPKPRRFIEPTCGFSGATWIGEHKLVICQQSYSQLFLNRWKIDDELSLPWITKTHEEYIVPIEKLYPPEKCAYTIKIYIKLSYMFHQVYQTDEKIFQKYTHVYIFPNTLLNVAYNNYNVSN